MNHHAEIRRRRQARKLRKLGLPEKRLPRGDVRNYKYHWRDEKKRPKCAAGKKPKRVEGSRSIDVVMKHPRKCGTCVRLGWAWFNSELDKVIEDLRVKQGWTRTKARRWLVERLNQEFGGHPLV